MSLQTSSTGRPEDPEPAELIRTDRIGIAPLPLLPRQRTEHGIALSVEDVDPTTGVRLRRLVVSDESDHSATRTACQDSMAGYDDALRIDLTALAPEVVDGELVVHNDASRWFYASPTLREWRTDLVPSAKALYPMQHPDLERLPSGGLVDDAARVIFRDCLDAIGIRTRARIMREVVLAASRRELPSGERARWVSLACGAAVPVLDALEHLAHHGAGRPFLELVDLDADALDFARDLARARGLREGRDYRLLVRNLVSTVVARTSLVEELGAGSATTVDAVGIFEYFRDAACVRLLRNAYELLAPGGVLVVANMLADRDQLAFNQRGAGWPDIHPRSVDQLVDLVRAAGLPLHRTTVSIPADGVYAVVDITRPL